MLLSIIIHGRNDNYMGGFIWRIQTVLNKIIKNVNDCKCSEDIEIVVLDWGSDRNRKLKDAIIIDQHIIKNVRFLYVDPETVKSVSSGSNYSSSHAMNCAIRRSNGLFVLSCDSDVYWCADTMVILLDALKNGHFRADQKKHNLNSCFFWSARRHIPVSFNNTQPSIAQIDEHIENNCHLYALDKPNQHNFEGAACALLGTKQMWFESKGLDEELVGWGYNDIQIHKRLLLRYTYGGDMDDYGLKFYHLEHYINRHVPGENLAQPNQHKWNGEFAVNNDNWGLRDQPVIEQIMEHNTDE